MAIPVAYPAELKEKGFRLYCSGIPHAEIARQLSVPVDAVRSWSYRGKWKARKLISGKGGKRIAASITAESVETIEEADIVTANGGCVSLESLDAMPFDEKQTHFRDRMALQALRIPDLIAGLSRDELLKHADRIHKLEQVARRALNLEDPPPAPVVNIGLLTTTGGLPPLEIGGSLGEKSALTE